MSIIVDMNSAKWFAFRSNAFEVLMAYFCEVKSSMLNFPFLARDVLLHFGLFCFILVRTVQTSQGLICFFITSNIKIITTFTYSELMPHIFTLVFSLLSIYLYLIYLRYVLQTRPGNIEVIQRVSLNP